MSLGRVRILGIRESGFAVSRSGCVGLASVLVAWDGVVARGAKKFWFPSRKDAMWLQTRHMMRYG